MKSKQSVRGCELKKSLLAQIKQVFFVCKKPHSDPGDYCQAAFLKGVIEVPKKKLV